MIPNNPKSPSRKNSPFSRPFICRYSREYKNTTPTTMYANILSTPDAGSVTKLPLHAITSWFTE